MNALLLALLAAAPGDGFVKERFGNHAVAQLRAPGVAELSLSEKKVAWHLSLAAYAGEPIAYDQLGWSNLAIKALLESVVLFGLKGDGADPRGFDARLSEYLKKLYGHGGNHDDVTGQKFLPEFTPEELSQAAKRALAAGAPLGVKDDSALEAHLLELSPALFDPTFEPLLTSKAPPPGKDILTASANTAYGRDVALSDLEGFAEKNPLNSRVVKVEGELVERVFRAGTPDKKVPPGLYAEELSRVVAHLREAMKHARADQRDALGKLVRYFQTGDLKDWDAYNIAWLKADPKVDANLGFIETYVDARGQKGQWEALVNYRDAKENQVMELLAKRAQYFEDRLPWPEQYKRKKVSPPVAKAINFLAAYPQPPAGINLPNEQHIREKYGSKSVLVANTMEAAAAVKRLPLAIEFSRTEEERESARKHAVTARKWLVAFHEVAGHASGQVDKQAGDTSKKLAEYDNTLEEARADLVALWHAFDPALEELSLEHEEVARQMYRSFLVEGLTNLHRVERGDELEEDHHRGHHMTVSFLIEKGAVRQVSEGKPPHTYWDVVDFPKMREAVGELLTKLMAIKATGDYEGIKGLVQRYGIKFDPRLRDEVVARVKAANVPTVTLMASPQLVPALDKRGNLVDLKVRYEQSFVDQHLERALLGSLAPAEATKLAAQIAASPEALHEALRKRAAAPSSARRE
ncbi:MAG: peptidase [Myxococcales bacterium]|nr:peptidase [Myxococcales bacterium]